MQTGQKQFGLKKKLLIISLFHFIVFVTILLLLLLFILSLDSNFKNPRSQLLTRTHINCKEKKIPSYGTNTHLFIVNQVTPSWAEELQIYTWFMVDFSLT